MKITDSEREKQQQTKRQHKYTHIQKRAGARRSFLRKILFFSRVFRLSLIFIWLSFFLELCARARLAVRENSSVCDCIEAGCFNATKYHFFYIHLYTKTRCTNNNIRSSNNSSNDSPNEIDKKKRVAFRIVICVWCERIYMYDAENAFARPSRRTKPSFSETLVSETHAKILLFFRFSFISIFLLLLFFGSSSYVLMPVLHQQSETSARSQRIINILCTKQKRISSECGVYVGPLSPPLAVVCVFEQNL